MKKGEIIAKRITKIALIALVILTILMIIYIVLFLNSCKGTKLITRKRYVGIEEIRRSTDGFVFNEEKYYLTYSVKPIIENFAELELIGYDGKPWFSLSNAEYRIINSYKDEAIVECIYYWPKKDFKGWSWVHVSDAFSKEDIKLNSLSLGAQTIQVSYDIVIDSLIIDESISDYSEMSSYSVGEIYGTIGEVFSFSSTIYEKGEKYYLYSDIVKGKGRFFELDNNFVEYIKEIQLFQDE